MRQLIFVLFAVLTTALLTACPDKGGSKATNDYLTSPNGCYNYYMDPATGQYYDNYGRVVYCDPGYYGDPNGYYAPYNLYSGGAYTYGCSAWTLAKGVTYIPIYVEGQGYICVSSMYFIYYATYVPNYSSYYNYYGTYPTYARSCAYGGCGNSCLGFSGSSDSGFWGGLSFCW